MLSRIDIARRGSLSQSESISSSYLLLLLLQAERTTTIIMEKMRMNFISYDFIRKFTTKNRFSQQRLNSSFPIFLPAPANTLEFAFQELANHLLWRTIIVPCSLAFSVYLPNANMTVGGGRTSRASLLNQLIEFMVWGFGHDYSSPS